MTIHSPHLCTRIPIFAPKYSGEDGWEVLLARSKVLHATGVIIIDFTKAKHLIGQRFCITRDEAQRCPVVTNGRIECFAVPFDKLEGWDSAAEVAEIAMGLFNE